MRPIVALGSSIYAAFFAWWLDPRLSRKSDEDFASDLEGSMDSWFSRHGMKLIPNDSYDRTEKRYFDLAYATASSGDFQLRFRRVRGQFDIFIRPPDGSQGWTELYSLLIDLDRIEGVETNSKQLYYATNAWDASKLLERNWARLTKAICPGGHKLDRRTSAAKAETSE